LIAGAGGPATAGKMPALGKRRCVRNKDSGADLGRVHTSSGSQAESLTGPIYYKAENIWDEF